MSQINGATWQADRPPQLAVENPTGRSKVENPRGRSRVWGVRSLEKRRAPPPKTHRNRRVPFGCNIILLSHICIYFIYFLFFI